MIKLFTHDDLDGIGCGFLAMMAFGGNVDISYCGHDNINTAVLAHFKANTKDEVHITDICVNSSIAKTIDESCRKYLVLDHHVTSMPISEKYKWCNVRIENKDGLMTSGTEMYYNWLVENSKLQRTDALDCFVELVRNYDTWRWVEMGNEGLICKDVNDLLYLYGKDAFVDWLIDQFDDNVFPYLYDSDIAVLDVNQRAIDEYVDEKEKQMIVANYGGHKVGFIFADRYFNDIGHRICELHPELDYVAMVDAGSGKVSCRTEKYGIDLGTIAKTFGGGGHPKAAGFGYDAYINQEMFGKIFNF